MSGRTSVDSGADSRFLFQAKEFDTELNLDLYYFEARFYNAEVGRFASPDPERVGWSYYAFCNNNPLRYIDPTGLDPQEPPGHGPPPGEEPPGEGYVWCEKWDGDRLEYAGWARVTEHQRDFATFWSQLSATAREVLDDTLMMRFGLNWRTLLTSSNPYVQAWKSFQITVQLIKWVKQALEEKQ